MKKKMVFGLFVLSLCLCFADKADNKQGAFEINLDNVVLSVEAKELPVKKYLSVKKTKTKFGSIEIPQFKKEIFDSQDIDMANMMFKSIEKTLLNSVKESERLVKKDDYSTKGLSKHILCETKTALTENILSVLVRYDDYDYNSPSLYFYEAVNIDINTGKAVSPTDIINEAGFSKKAVEDSLLWYGEKCQYYFWERQKYYEFGASNMLPDSSIKKHPKWKNELNSILKTFRAKPKSKGVGWDSLDRYPTVFYEGEKKLSVGAEIPTMAGVGYAWTMVNIGDSLSEVNDKNSNNCYGEAFGNKAISADAARIAVSNVLELDKNGKNADGVKLFIEPCYIETLEFEKEKYEPFYVLKVYESMKTHTATFGWWKVGVFSGTVLEEDIATGEHRRCP